MYEYIPNKIIEGSIMFFWKIGVIIINSLNDTFIGNHYNMYYMNEIGWEYDIIYIFKTICDYFFIKEEANDESVTKYIQKDIPYIEKYKDEFKKNIRSSKSLEDLDLHSLKNNILLEKTPFGNVIMYYDFSKQSFIYYCDKTLSYPYVNTVGRKYVITFGCEKLYFYDTDENKKSNETNISEYQKGSKLVNMEKSNNKNVYAKFKKYENQNKPNILDLKKENVELTEEKINRYTCEGKLSNFNFLKKVQKVKPFSYKDFKLKNQKTP